jgi:hypothetical protein
MLIPMLSVGSTLANLDGDGMVELVNASRKLWTSRTLDLPGSFQRRDYFAINKLMGTGHIQQQEWHGRAILFEGKWI